MALASPSRSTSNEVDQDKVQNQELVIAEIENGLKKWSIPEINLEKYINRVLLV